MKDTCTFQWSLFTNDRQGQVVVRAETYEEFTEAYVKMQEFIETNKLLEAKTVNANQQPIDNDPPWIKEDKKQMDEAIEESTSSHVCTLHGKEMKLRENRKTGGTFYDHRRKDDDTGQWYACKGTGWKES